MQSIKKAIIITCLVASAAMIDTPRAAPTTSQPIVMGYWENWGTYRGFPMPDNAKHESNYVLSGQLTGINAIAYSFLEVSSNGTLIFSDVWSDLDPNSSQDKAFCAASPASCKGFPENAGLGNFSAFAKTSVAHHVLSVGGAGHDDAWENAFANPDQFVTSLKALVNVYHIDWLDIDYEPISGVPAQHVKGLITLTNKIKQALPDLLLSYTIPANAESVKQFGNANWAQIAKNVAYVNIMGYDMHGSFDKSNPFTALHSALLSDTNGFSDENTIKALNTAGIPNNKMILGMPLYGRAVGGVQATGLGQTFTQAFQGDLDDSCSVDLNAGNVCSGMIQYKTLVDQQYAAEPGIVNGKLSGVYAYDASKKMFVSYDNAQSATAKAQYVLDNKLAGAMFWALRFDKPIDDAQSVIGAVDKVFGIKPTPTPAPQIKMKLELTNNDPNNPITITLVTADKSAYYPFPVLNAQSGKTYTDLDSSIVNTLMSNNAVLVLLTPARGNQLWCQGKLNFTSGNYHHIQVYYDSPVPNCAIN